MPPSIPGLQGRYDDVVDRLVDIHRCGHHYRVLAAGFGEHAPGGRPAGELPSRLVGARQDDRANPAVADEVPAHFAVSRRRELEDLLGYPRSVKLSDEHLCCNRCFRCLSSTRALPAAKAATAPPAGIA